MFCCKTGNVENKLPPGTPWAACSAGKDRTPSGAHQLHGRAACRPSSAGRGVWVGAGLCRGCWRRSSIWRVTNPQGCAWLPPHRGGCWHGEDGWEQRCQRGLCVKNNNNNFHCFDVCTQLNANALPERCLALGAGLGPEVSEPDSACPTAVSLPVPAQHPRCCEWGIRKEALINYLQLSATSPPHKKQAWCWGRERLAPCFLQ